jgi:hypothetical protein
MPFQCSVEDGILVVRATGVLKMTDMDFLVVEEERYFATPDCKGLFLIDCADLKVISPDGRDAMVERMKVDNPRIVRSAFVVGEGTAALQLARMIRDAGSDLRRTFTSEGQAWAWLLAG